jgi:mannose-6-phosphate isomerase-like protein (cupin superfamily)
MTNYTLIKKLDSTFRQITETKTANNYITKDISPNFSVATTRAYDCKEIETTDYDRVYFVLEGVLELTFGDDKVEVKSNDSIFIKAKSTYTISGTFNTIVINQPAFGTLT